MITQTIDTDRGPVEFTESGTGDPILYFHGTGLTGEAMLPFELPLVESGFRLIVPNRPGYGNTPLSEHRSATDCADVAAALLDALNIGAAGVMGSSGGAAFATSFAIHHASRTNSLVLLCPQLHRWDHRRWLPASSRWTLPFVKRRWLRRLLLKLYAMQFPRMTAEQFLKMEAGDRYASVSNDLAAQEVCQKALTAMSYGITQPGFENDFVVFTNEAILNDTTRITLPVLVIHDSHDPMAPVEHVDWFTSIVKHCERVPVHTAGHLIWVGPDANLMHDTRVRFLRAHAQNAT
jgi:pimeloyl-ACP methyl ester carboxylesterase